jgi:hypothetical protein
MILDKQTRVEIFGSKSDPEVKESVRKIRKTGRSVKIIARPDEPTGLGPCGKHYCQCSTPCNGAYKGDEGATMGGSF